MNNDNPILEIDDEISFLTKGASMRPMLREHRDIAVITTLKGEVKKGDVLLYRRAEDKPLVLHRVVKLQNGALVLRGDNNAFDDEPIEIKDIVGILKGFYREGRYFDCQKSIAYRIYTFWICSFYWLRKFYKITIRKNLSKIKRKIIK